MGYENITALADAVFHRMRIRRILCDVTFIRSIALSMGGEPPET